MARFVASSLFSCAALMAVLSSVACSGGEIAVGRTDQELKTKRDGSPTGDGRTCSWDDTVSYDVATGKETTTPAPNGPYVVGDNFSSLDGCNDCSCTARGIMCTVRQCSDPGGKACPEIARICPDGSVARTGPNCEHICDGQSVCDADAKQCPDGSSVGRTGPKCEFAPCPGEVTTCMTDAKQCPDGSFVGRTGPKCEFAPCP